MLKVNFDDLESLDYNMNLEVTYNDKPFTGIAFEDTPHYYNECEYVDGYRHGRDYCIYKSGNLKSEDFYENGEFLHGKEWYENGQIKENRTPLLLKQWYENGVTRRDTNYEIGKTLFYYENGYIRDDITFKKTDIGIIDTLVHICYAENQCEIFRKTKTEEDTTKNYVKGYNGLYILFNDESMINNFDFMCNDFYFLQNMRIWIIDFLNRDFQKAYKLLEKMLNHENLRTKNEAILICGWAKTYNAIPILETLLEINEIPKMHVDPFTLGGNGWTRTIGQQAKTTIDELKKM